MTRYRPSDLDRLGESARRQIAAAKFAYEERDRQKAGKADKDFPAFPASGDDAKRNKFGNVPTTLDGRRFDSRLEADRYAELKILQRAGRISELICQPEFPIAINGHVICKYIADFEYTDENGRRIIEDCKSKPTMTPLYRLKKRLMSVVLGLDITEVER